MGIETLGSGRLHPVSRVLAGLGLLLSSPAVAAGAVAIRLSSPGPVLFRAARVGRDGRRFSMLKLRTMHRQPDGVSARITGGRDPRVFAAGRVLRRIKVDEIPQLVNILRGEMTLVGPRPEDPSIVEDHYTPFMLQTLAVLPGLTSPGSLHYYADEARLPDDAVEAEKVYVAELLPRKIALDLVYIRNRSWRYDVEVVVRTIASMVGFTGLSPRRQAWERGEAERLLALSDSDGHPPHAVSR